MGNCPSCFHRKIKPKKLNPLLLSPILRNVFEYAEVETLKASRLVCSSWNEEAGPILSSSSWINSHKHWEYCECDPLKAQDCTKLDDLIYTLTISPDPSKFFGKLLIDDDLECGWAWDFWTDMERSKDLLQEYGKYLNTLDCQFNWKNLRARNLNGSTASQLFLHVALSEWCPHLQEIRLTVEFGVWDWPIGVQDLALQFKAPLKLRSIQLKICCQLKDGLQDFLVQIVAASPNLKVLRISTGEWNNNDRFYRNLTALKNMTKNLSELNWIRTIGSDYNSAGGSVVGNDREILSTIQFSNQLKTLRLHYKLHPTSFPFVTELTGNSLRTLELMSFGFDMDDQIAMQYNLFQTVITKLVNLETLRLGLHHCRHDYFLHNAYGSDDLMAPPHHNLRRLLLPWCEDYNLVEVSSVRNVIKWFPNLTLLSLCLGDKKSHFDHLGTMGVIRLEEAVGILSGLTGLKDLSLRLCSIAPSRYLQLALKALHNFPCLQRCTIVEFETHWKITRTIYDLENLKDDLNGLQHLSFIRLIGFEIYGQEKILNFAKKNGIKLELINHDKPLYTMWDNQTWEDRWMMTYPLE